ncbi:MAG TPA: BsuPI-related putative proteinase inhibitor [Gemmatimonadales bacterium]
MYSRFVVPLLCVSALAFACGPRSHSADVPPAAAGATVDTTEGLAASLDVRTGDEVEFALRVTNATDRRFELTFPSGQTHDVVVLDAAGREVWRWSEGRMFTQAVQTKLLGSEETASYVEKWRPEGRAGSYTVIATLRSSNHPVELRRGFTLP